MAEHDPADENLIRTPIALRIDQLRALEELARKSGVELDTVIRSQLDMVLAASRDQRSLSDWRTAVAETASAFSDDADYTQRMTALREGLKSRAPAAWPGS